MNFYKIELYHNNLLGYITFNLNNNKINVLYIHINQPGKKYGSFLLLIFMSYVINYIEHSLISGIYLDDCSDLAGTTQSIYYKFGLRVLNKKRQEEMGIRFLKSLNRSVKISSSSDIPTAKKINFNTFIHYYNSLLKNHHNYHDNCYFIVYNNNKKILIQKPDIREIPILKRNTRR